MPETNLLPLLLNKSEATNINLIKQTLPEMPSETREQLINDSVITEHAIILVVSTFLNFNNQDIELIFIHYIELRMNHTY